MNRTDVNTRNRSWSVFSMCSHRHLNHAVLTGPFRLVHRLVRLAQQLVAPRFRARNGDDADAGRDGGGPAEHRADPDGSLAHAVANRLAGGIRTVFRGTP